MKSPRRGTTNSIINITVLIFELVLASAMKYYFVINSRAPGIHGEIKGIPPCRLDTLLYALIAIFDVSFLLRRQPYRIPAIYTILQYRSCYTNSFKQRRRGVAMHRYFSRSRRLCQLCGFSSTKFASLRI